MKAGWGDWAGPGNMLVSNKILNTRNRLMKRVDEDSEEKKKGRKDTKIPNVMISERKIKTAAKYKITDVPHPFISREEYERSLLMPVGGEWNASNVVNSNTMPAILLRAGRIVEPITLPKGQKRQRDRDSIEGKKETIVAASKASGPLSKGSKSKGKSNRFAKGRGGPSKR